jgi:hypothetical protein
MSRSDISRVTVKPGEKLPRGTSDSAQIAAMSNADDRCGKSDPDAQPMTPEQLAAMRRVSRVKFCDNVSA